ncbi:glycosyltransferase [Limnohabitans sp. WS1]|uniref:glycosyltransferase family protein n=1 Tax=Limnohabitans sp. WS1 TaxID=1100726 RepID=UPI001304A488|nr:glycosyltransferase [Limnohabitans sp. WS1]
MKIIYVGESWLGSCARSLKEALARNSQVDLDEVNEDHFFPKHRAKWLRGIHRLLRQSYRQELYREILARVAVFQPDYVIVYKGYSLDANFVGQLRSLGVQTVNIYPDCSPHAHGERHRKAVGAYDLVISTKSFHPALWQSSYGYANTCAFVPQGYDPNLHLVASPPVEQLFDVLLIANWRIEYGDLMKRLAVLLERHQIKVGIGGPGWLQHRSEFPADWVFVGAMVGRSYVEWLRQGKICIAPVTREVVINGARQHGDEDTTRTYELAAAHCFFIHRRTDFVKTLYCEEKEVPMFDSPEELAAKILYYLPRSEERSYMAGRANMRAVAFYSTDSRAAEVVTVLSERLAG